jgi:hypothetical protein
VLLLLAVALGIATIVATLVCVFHHGGAWPAPLGSGVSTAVMGGAATLTRHQEPGSSSGPPDTPDRLTFDTPTVSGGFAAG